MHGYKPYANKENVSYTFILENEYILSLALRFYILDGICIYRRNLTDLIWQ